MFLVQIAITRLAICLNMNEAFLGSKLLNPFHNRKFNLEQIFIQHNGLSVADSPISTDDSKRVYFNIMSNLAYIDILHGISLEDYPNHFFMIFDLMSTQQLSVEFIHPELTNYFVSIELKFSVALAHNVETFIIDEKASTYYIDSAPKVSKNRILTKFQRCSALQYAFRGVYAADNFPTDFTDNSFIIVKNSTSTSFGTHWVLLCPKRSKLFLQIP